MRVAQHLSLASILLLSACTQPDQAVHTVDYYRSHTAERATRVHECSKDPGGIGGTADCKNAKQAESIEGVGSFKKLPPMEMPPTR